MCTIFDYNIDFECRVLFVGRRGAVPYEEHVLVLGGLPLVRPLFYFHNYLLECLNYI